MVYNREIDDPELMWRIIRAKLWDAGHSFDEIDNMSLFDVGDILGYWAESKRASDKTAKYNNSGG